MDGQRVESIRRGLRRTLRRLARRIDLAPLQAWRGRGAPPGLRTAKTTLAAVLAWQLALPLPGDQLPVLAPLTALLVTQLTLIQTVTGSLQRVGSVVVGVVVAVLVADLLGVHWWSLGVVIFASLILGQILKLGSHRMEVPISALLVLTVGGTPGVARTRLLETLVGAGAGVGVIVNAVLVPPVYVRPAGQAIYELAADMARVLEGVADELAEGWSGEDAYERLLEARELDGPVGQAKQALARAEDSLRLNPRRRLLGDPSDELRESMTTLEHSAILVRGICRSLVDLDTVSGGRGPDPELRAALANLLREVAGAIRAFGELVAASVPGPPANQAPLHRALARARAAREEVAAVMVARAREQLGPGRSTATCSPMSTVSSPSLTPTTRPGRAAHACRDLASRPSWMADRRRAACAGCESGHTRS
jgi:aromatic acid exporter family member 1